MARGERPDQQLGLRVNRERRASITDTSRKSSAAVREFSLDHYEAVIARC
jgi:hypothetical protein